MRAPDAGARLTRVLAGSLDALLGATAALAPHEWAARARRPTSGLRATSWSTSSSPRRRWARACCSRAQPRRRPRAPRRAPPSRASRAERGRGGLILLSSIVGFQGAPHAAHSAATKAHVQTLAEALHVELAPRGVDVLAAAPGPTHGGFAARAGMRLGVALAPRDVAQPTLDALGRRGTVLPGALSRSCSPTRSRPSRARRARASWAA